jgi:hypothetical protein
MSVLVRYLHIRMDIYDRPVMRSFYVLRVTNARNNDYEVQTTLDHMRFNRVSILLFSYSSNFRSEWRIMK